MKNKFLILLLLFVSTNLLAIPKFEYNDRIKKYCMFNKISSPVIVASFEKRDLTYLLKAHNDLMIQYILKVPSNDDLLKQGFKDIVKQVLINKKLSNYFKTKRMLQEISNVFGLYRLDQKVRITLMQEVLNEINQSLISGGYNN
ncbi:MAG: hypothetical protein P4L22_03285 [Candidatus Babeliales bacterium]|nr:hypothetical protein [Candidatus Babeliales bacterium]